MAIEIILRAGKTPVKYEGDCVLCFTKIRCGVDDFIHHEVGYYKGTNTIAKETGFIKCPVCGGSDIIPWMKCYPLPNGS